METLRKHKALIAAVALLILAIAYIVGAANIRIYKGAGASSVGSAFYPRVLGWLLAALSVIQIGTALRKTLSSAKKGIDTPAKQKETSFLSIAAVVILTAVYIALLEIVGFLIMSALYLFGMMFVLAPKAQRKPLVAAIISVVASNAVYFTFVKGFSLLLPAGILG
jgi:putative tricarboxylic transport membrane protein